MLRAPSKDAPAEKGLAKLWTHRQAVPASTDAAADSASSDERPTATSTDAATSKPTSPHVRFDKPHSPARSPSHSPSSAASPASSPPGAPRSSGQAGPAAPHLLLNPPRLLRGLTEDCHDLEAEVNANASDAAPPSLEAAAAPSAPSASSTAPPPPTKAAAATAKAGVDKEARSSERNKRRPVGTRDRYPKPYGALLIDFLKLWGEDFTAGEEGFSVRRGGLRFPVSGQVPHPQAADPVVIEDPLNVMNNVGRSSYNFVQVQRLFNDAHAKIRHSAITLDVSPRTTIAAAGARGGGAGTGIANANANSSGEGSSNDTVDGGVAAEGGGGDRGAAKSGATTDDACAVSTDGTPSKSGTNGEMSTEIAADPDAAPRKGEVAFRLLELETEASQTGMLAVAMGGPGVTPGSYWGGAYSPVPGAQSSNGSGLKSGFK
mmetsp:Transcript_15995/g.29116  ORF Transcript_15995/g.29116 Transcript_15995/m.29116 type:complete len:433 (+) Transcript_15995:2-1300(+)